MKTRIWSMSTALLLLVGTLGLTTPTAPAQAAVTTPFATTSGIMAFQLTGLDNGGLQITGCNPGADNDTQMMYLDTSGVERNAISGTGSPDGSTCARVHDHGGSTDGTLYGTRYSANEDWSTLVAWKNGRQLWERAITASSPCASSGSWASYLTTAESISEGPDGNIYMIVANPGGMRTCEDRLVGIDAQTGVILFDQPLGSGLTGSAASLAWTYDDKIIVIDRDSKVREFNYSGVENVSATYQFPVPIGHKIRSIIAGEDGTIYAMTERVSNYASEPTLLYYRQDQTHGSIPDIYADRILSHIRISSTGDIIGIPADGTTPRIDYFDIDLNTVTAAYPAPQTAGYTNVELVDYFEDENANTLSMWQSWDNTGLSWKTVVELFDTGSMTTSEVFIAETKHSDLSNFPEHYPWSSPIVVDGNFYLATCEHDFNTCYNYTQAADMSIYKIDIENFGDTPDEGFKRNSYKSQKLQYVAMGDSFSSGEGVDPFTIGTAISGVNECHRSKEAYPLLLEEDSALNLDLVAFTACSGATTKTLLNGGSTQGAWNEPAQIDALSMDTDVVTLTIGGNDTGFATVLTACVKAPYSNDGWGCSQDNDVITPVADNLDALAGVVANPSIHSIEYVLLQVASSAPNAKIRVAGYPHLFGGSIGDYEPHPEAPGYGRCVVAWWSGVVSVSYNDAQWINAQTDALNSVLTEAVDKVRTNTGKDIEYILPEGMEGHGLCDSGESYISPVYLSGDLQEPDVSPYSFHPTSEGVLRYLYPFELSL